MMHLSVGDSGVRIEPSPPPQETEGPTTHTNACGHVNINLWDKSFPISNILFYWSKASPFLYKKTLLYLSLSLHCTVSFLIFVDLHFLILAHQPQQCSIRARRFYALVIEIALPQHSPLQ
ncbi:hypothetical protein KP509_12G075000 [Ceratopteris richardii]|uniref:Uncharacterized protein n=1 Tax=Ceratopteris richardii TaxID=49495 RepID=A0A8T2TM97_CERRI|nr:hypothetical protein KP509_12G075000 [Ceratopteris richardii]